MIKLTKRTIFLLTLTIIISALLAPSAFAKSSWHGMKLNLTTQQRNTFVDRFERGNPDYLYLVKKAAPHVTVRLAKKNDPMGGNFTMTSIDGNGTSFEVVLQKENFKPSNQLGKHLQYHEFGHVIVNSWLMSYEGLFNYWSKSPLWKSCYIQGPDALEPCVPFDEIAADQFAFWAGSGRNIRSSYKVPPLGTAAAMTKILKKDGVFDRAKKGRWAQP